MPIEVRRNETDSVQLGGSLWPLDSRENLVDRLALLSTDNSLHLRDEERMGLDRARVGLWSSSLKLLGNARDLPSIESRVSE